MALHLIQSQRIDVLVDAMLTHVQQAKQSPLAVLQSQHFIVPSKAVEEWLMQRISERQGISANSIFHHRIRAFQWQAYQWVLQDQREKVRKANIPRIIMQWRVFHYLQPMLQHAHNPLPVGHALQRLIQRIYDSAENLQGLHQQQKKQHMLYWIAEKVSRLFSNYMLYRGFCQYGCRGRADCQHNWLAQWGQDQALNIAGQIYKAQHYLDEDEKLAAEKIAAFTQEQAEELEQWQRWLWLQLFDQDYQAMQEIDGLFWQALGEPEQASAALKKLPSQLVIFTLLELPPSQLYFMRRLAQYLDIYVLHYNPSQEYWADMVDPKWKAKVDARIKDRFILQQQQKGRSVSDADIQAYIEKYNGHFNADMRESHHPLLTRFGKQARDHFSLLSVLSSGEEGEWYDYFPEPEATHLLAKIQADVLNLAEPEAQAYTLDPTDDSIQVHVCHSSQRQLEVLKDQLIRWLAQDASRQASDILVLSPNLKDQESAIRSVFAAPPSERDLLAAHKTEQQHQLSQDTLYLPIQIAGVSSLDANNAWRSVLGRIQLVEGRFSLEEFSDWLSLEATQQRYNIDLDDIERMLALLQAAGFRRGLNASHLQRSLSEQDHDHRYSFKFALDRLAMGVAVPEHVMVKDTLSYAQVLASDFSHIASLIQIYQDFEQRQDWLIEHESGRTRTVEQWLNVLMQEVAEFQAAGVEVLSSVYKLISKHERMLTLASHFEDEQELDLRTLILPLPYLLQEISSQLETQLEQATPSGSISFSQMGSIRPLPYKLIVMLNLDSGTFPNRDQHLPFDLMALLKPQLGDRSRLEDDQGAFLDALLLAQENLWLFYNGFDMNDGEVRDPSSVLNEFIQHVALIVANPEGTAAATLNLNGIEVPAQLAALYHVHPLQPFELEGFHQQKSIRYQDQWFRVAQRMQHSKVPREAWFSDYPSLEQNLIVLDSQPWIQDVCFPARAYLKAINVENMNVKELLSTHEPLLLDGLQRYQVRDFLLQAAEKPIAITLLQDQLPVGKTLNATWQQSVQEQQYLKERLAHYSPEITATTQQVWKVNPNIQMNIRVPAQATTLWATVLAARASSKRYAQVWLEYLLWLGHANLGDAGQDYQRVVVCSTGTIHFAGLSSNQARHYVMQWLDFWQQAQRQPILLPAELVLKMNAKAEFEIRWDDADPQQVINMDKFQNAWKDTWSNFIGEASVQHQDWSFILQDADAESLLQHAFAQYSHALYAPLIAQRMVEEA